MENRDRPPLKKRTKRLATALLAVCIGLFVLLRLRFLMMPVSADATATPVGFDVSSGENVSQVATALHERKLIRSAFAFKLYSRYLTHAQPLLAGHYALTRGMSISEILDVLEHGRVAVDVVKVTIPEGFTVTQIAERLSADGVCSKTDFLAAVQKGSFSEPFLSDVKENKNVKYRFEGYLFPDTYDFDKHESAYDIVNEMLLDFQNRVGGSLLHNALKEGKSLGEVITEASLIEKEAKVESERPIIASVINNRLSSNPPMKLQLDATIEYILGHQNIVTDADLRVNNPYNTYLYPGLPPGPIANPGLLSIEAVLNPAHTSYYYYVVKNNGSGEHYFSKTFSQQLRNEQLSQENLAEAEKK